jgi:hypothetical protein
MAMRPLHVVELEVMDVVSLLWLVAVAKLLKLRRELETTGENCQTNDCCYCWLACWLLNGGIIGIRSVGGA